MTSEFVVEPEIFSHFQGMQLVVAIARGIDNQAENASVRANWQAAWAGVAEFGIDDARLHPYVDAWRKHFAVLGVSMKRFPTSVEAMLRRALKGGDPFTINPVVDFYNTLTLRHACPAGAFNLGVIHEPIQLRRTLAADRFTALGSDTEIELSVGEIAYASGHSVLTRHFMWRQSVQGLISEDSTDVFFVSEIPGIAGSEVAQTMCDDLVNGLANCFGCESVSFILDAQRTRVTW